MGSSVGTITADFDARSAKFAAELEKVSKGITGLQKQVKGTQDFFKGLAATFATALSAGAIVSFIKSAGDAQEQLAETAQRIGITTTALKALQLVTRETGGSVESLQKILLLAQRGLGEAAAGVGDTRKTIQGLGLDIATLKNLSPDQLFLAYADAINKLGDRNQQNAAANALFGKSYAEVLNVIRAGRPAFEEAAGAVVKLGLALSPEQVALIDRAGDSFGRVKDAAQAFGARIAASVAPFLIELSKNLLDTAQNADQLQASIDAFVFGAVAGFLILENGVNSLKAAFFGLASAGARVLQLRSILSLDFDTARSFGASAAANLELAQKALAGVRSLDQIREEIIRIREVADAEARNAVAQAAGGGGGGGGQFDVFGATGVTFDTSRFDAIKLATKGVFDEEEELRQKNLDAIEQYTERMIQIYASGELQRVSVVEQAAAVERQVRADTTNAAIGFLNVLGQKSKAAAIAAIILNRAIGISQAIQNTAVAVTKTLASLPYPANVAAAASVQAMGSIQVGLIAATGALEIGNVLGGNRGGIGNTGIGTPTNPLPVTPQDALGAQQGKVIQVNLNGPIAGPEASRWLVDALADLINGNDTIIISSNSAQAAEIRGG